MSQLRLGLCLTFALSGCLDLSRATDSGVGGGFGILGGGYGGGFIVTSGGGTAATGGGTAATGGGTAATGGGAATAGGGAAATGGGTAATGGGAGATGGGTSATGGGATGGGTSATGGGATGGGTAATGGGTAVTCAPACPAGFLCNTHGQCEGDQTALMLDAQSVALTTKLKVNGALPLTRCASSTTDAVGLVRYVAPTDVYATFTDAFTCAETTFTHTLAVAPADVWALQVDTGNFSANLPSGIYDAGVVQLTTAATVTLDIPSVQITGAITANQASVNCLTSQQIGGIAFKSSAGTYSEALMCVAGQGARFNLKMPPGVYEVYAWAYDAQTMLAQPPYLLASSQVITASTSLTFNETTWLVSLPVTLNGAVPTDDCATNPGGFAKVSYFFEAGGFRPMQYGLGCGQPHYIISARVGPNDFRVAISSDRHTLPDDPILVNVSTNGPGTYPVDVVANQIAGTITLNGAPLTNCSEYFAVVLSQSETDPFSWKFFSLPITCGATTTFKGWVPAGDYQLSFNGTFPMPTGWPQSAGYSRRFKVNGNSFNTAIDLKTTSITVKPLANGAVPVFTSCSGSTAKLSVSLDSPDHNPRTSAYATIPCSNPNAQVTAPVFTGTYAIKLNSSASNLPQGYLSPTLVTVNAPVTVTVDAPSRHVSGFLTVNHNSIPGCIVGARMGYLTFSNGETGAGVDLNCDGRGVLTFDVSLAPGVYEASVYGTAGAGNTVPLGTHVLVKKLLVQ